MDDRFSARLSGALLLAALAVAGCEQGAATQAAESGPASVAGARQNGGITEAERRLQKRSAAMQRTILEASGSGAALGAGAGILFGADAALLGALLGAGTGASAGSYVAVLQQEYETDEQRLDRMIADLETANADAEGVLEAMRAVLAEQTAQIAEIRAAVAADATARTILAAELESLRQNVETMQAAISGADQRLADVRSARGVVQSAQAVAALDPRLGELSRRIAAMRDIATTLAQEA